MKNDAVFDLSHHPVHRGLGASIHPQPEHTGTMEWYMAYGARHGSDGAEGRLVAVHTFSRPWDTWEVHPEGEELVVCLAGELVLHQELGDEVRTVTLRPYEAVVNPRGVWHTADATSPTTAMFITAGIGTENRPRS
jgi:mannose-6-phosphate isomerase-like protein (cupin superfamily)